MVFGIAKSERLTLVKKEKGFSKLQKFQNETGADIRIEYDQTDDAILKIFGYPSQREEAKVLIRDTLEKTSFIPMISNFMLSKSNSNRKLQFVEYDGEDDSNRTTYCVEFTTEEQEETDDVSEIISKFGDFQITTPAQFNTFDEIDNCLDQLSLTLNSNFRQRSEKSLFSNNKVILKPRIFLGKVLFSEIDDPEESFTLREWYRFNIRSRRGSYRENDDGNNNKRVKRVNSEFQQYSSQVFDKFELFEQKYGFELDDEKVIEGVNKGCVYIYYNNSTHNKRKLKLRWDEEEDKWKIANHSYGITRVANVDVISGTKAPDFRFSLKTNYDLPPEGSKVEEVIDKIQIAPTFAEREGMYFRSKDFDGTLIRKAVVRQIIEKRRFRNQNFLITFSTIKHEEFNDRITIQKLITLKHQTWNQEISYDEEFMINVNDTIRYVKKMMDVLI